MSIIEFPARRDHGPEQARGGRAKARRRAGGPNMHTFLLFRSYTAILEAAEADLVRDVGFDLHKAEVKLRKVRERLQGIREQAATQIEMLTEVDNRLSAAIVAALLSTRRPAGRGQQ